MNISKREKLSFGTVMKLGEGSCLLEKTHQSNHNQRKNDIVLMPKGEFKLALNPAQCGAAACVW